MYIFRITYIYIYMVYLHVVLQVHSLWGVNRRIRSRWRWKRRPGGETRAVLLVRNQFMKKRTRHKYIAKWYEYDVHQEKHIIYIYTHYNMQHHMYTYIYIICKHHLLNRQANEAQRLQDKQLGLTQPRGEGRGYQQIEDPKKGSYNKNWQQLVGFT